MPELRCGWCGDRVQKSFLKWPRLCLPRSRNNLSQWEKVIRGEESALGTLDTPEAPEPSEKLPRKTGD